MENFSGDVFGLTSPAFFHEPVGHEPVDGCSEKSLEVTVIFTDTPGTLAALQRSERLAQQLGAHLRLLMPYEVSYALPLTKPPVSVEFLESQMRDLAGKTGMEVEAQVCLCRDKKSALGNLLPPKSLVVVGGKKRWWPTSGQRLAQSLEKDGHHVIFADLR